MNANYNYHFVSILLQCVIIMDEKMNISGSAYSVNSESRSSYGIFDTIILDSLSAAFNKVARN